MGEEPAPEGYFNPYGGLGSLPSKLRGPMRFVELVDGVSEHDTDVIRSGVKIWETSCPAIAQYGASTVSL